jgi:hypothetical protein
MWELDIRAITGGVTNQIKLGDIKSLRAILLLDIKSLVLYQWRNQIDVLIVCIFTFCANYQGERLTTGTLRVIFVYRGLKSNHVCTSIAERRLIPWDFVCQGIETDEIIQRRWHNSNSICRHWTVDTTVSFTFKVLESLRRGLRVTQNQVILVW